MIERKVEKEFRKNETEIMKPKYREPNELSHEQLTDSDYAIKELEKLNKGKLSITCSKCHHCR